MREETFGSVSPLEFKAGCAQTQHCLHGIADDELMNLASGATDDVGISFDEFSRLNVFGGGSFIGPEQISEQRLNPYLNYSSAKSFSQSAVQTLRALPRESSITTSYYKAEFFKEDAPKIRMAQHTAQQKFYPCSAVRKEETVSSPVPKNLLDEVSVAKRGDAATTLCNKLMSDCTGVNAQFDSFAECKTYMDALPITDAKCSAAFDGSASASDSVMFKGHSFGCKYAHHFMIESNPASYCFAAGKGGIDASGAQKCAPQDCNATLFNSANQGAVYPQNGAGKGLNFVPAAQGGRNHPDWQAAVQEKAKPYARCTPKLRDELHLATLHALPYCMSSLATQECSANCTQAVNTYLGRFVENGALCDCELQDDKESHMNVKDNAKSGSLLSMMKVSAGLLIDTCKAGSYSSTEKYKYDVGAGPEDSVIDSMETVGLMFSYPSCLHDLSHSYADSFRSCGNPREYRTT
jgi:hypothetical protein